MPRFVLADCAAEFIAALRAGYWLPLTGLALAIWAGWELRRAA